MLKESAKNLAHFPTTSENEFKTPIQLNGVILEPFNPITVAIALDASFIARTFAGDIKETKEGRLFLPQK